VTQRLSYTLARHIAEHAPFVSDQGIDQSSLNKLFDMLMVVNPSIEVYLLDADGRIKAHLAPPGHVKRERVAMDPIRRFLAGQPLPIEGDDPRSASQRNVFSVAPLTAGSRTVGYVYVVLLGETHAALSADVGANSVLRTTLWSMAVVAAGSHDHCARSHPLYAHLKKTASKPPTLRWAPNPQASRPRATRSGSCKMPSGT
jgi:hypothetical protein